MLSIAGCAAPAQTVVMAPGSQVPGPPLPRYVYNVVSADFAVAEGHPLVKSKFNLYDTIGPTRQQFDRNIGLMRELNVDTYRLELGWGRNRQGHGMNAAVGGTLENLTYDFAPVDHIVSELRGQDVGLSGSYCYTPTPLQDPSLSPRYGDNNQKSRDATPPKNLDKWKEVITAFRGPALDLEARILDRMHVQKPFLVWTPVDFLDLGARVYRQVASERLSHLRSSQCETRRNSTTPANTCA